MNKILVINPGSTSTKFAVFIEDELIFQETILHTSEELSIFDSIIHQYDFRKNLLLNSLKQQNISVSDFSVVIGRGGLIQPLHSGVYTVNEKMLYDLRNCVYSEAHACNLGGLIAYEIAQNIPDCLALIADPVVVDELQDVARISGLPQFPRRSLFHALNHKAMAHKYAREQNKKYEGINLIIAHLGGGISVAAHKQGKVVDVNQALDGYGPFSPERAGTLASGELVRLCFNGKYSEKEIKKMLVGHGGVFAHLGSTDIGKITKNAQQGDEKSAEILKAMAYNIAKEIGSMFAVLGGNVDAIILTGGIAYEEFIVDYIKNMIQSFAPIVVYPGENEIVALAANALRVLRGDVPKVY